MLRKPPDVLITTPESLYLMLTSRAREMLTAVEAVIVDEIHAVAHSKRGADFSLGHRQPDTAGARDELIELRRGRHIARRDPRVGFLPAGEGNEPGEQDQNQRGNAPDDAHDSLSHGASTPLDGPSQNALEK